MTPPAAVTAGAPPSGLRARRPPPPGRRAIAMPRGARRASGPRGGLGALRAGGIALPAGAGGRAGSLYLPLGVRLVRRAAGVQDARLLDRLIRGRLWIGLIGAMLIGLVFLQLSLLSLNAGIGDALQTSTVLEGRNAALRLQVSTMDAGQRVQDTAARRGMLMPAAGAVQYVTAGTAGADAAARAITAPRPAPAATTPPAPAGTAPPGTAAATPVPAVTPRG